MPLSKIEMTQFHNSIHTPSPKEPIYPVPKQKDPNNNATCLHLEKLCLRNLSHFIPSHGPLPHFP